MKRLFYCSVIGKGKAVVILLVMCLAVSICLCGCRVADTVGDTQSESLAHIVSEQPASTLTTDTYAPDTSSESDVTTEPITDEIDVSNVYWAEYEIYDAVFLAHLNWHGKTVRQPLYDVLENGYTWYVRGAKLDGTKYKKIDDADPVYAIRGVINEFEFNEYGYMEYHHTYKGKTYDEYYAEYHEAYKLISDPQTRYENMVRFEIAKAAYNEAQEYCKEQNWEYQKNALPRVQEYLAQNGIQSEVKERIDIKYTLGMSDEIKYYIIIYATAEQFAELDLTQWNMVFRWATISSYSGNLSGVSQDPKDHLIIQE